MNFLQWLAAGSIFSFAYTIGWFKGRGVGRTEGFLRGRSINRHVSNQVNYNKGKLIHFKPKAETK